MNFLFSRISLSSLAEHVFLAFEGDEKLLKQYHISPGTLEHCVEHTVKFIVDNAAHYNNDIEFYAIIHDKITIGYTVIIRNEGANELYSFGINIKYRTEEIRDTWLREIEILLGLPYYIVLWNRNFRAIKFFEKQGFTILRSTKYLDDETKTLIVCPK